MTFVIIGGGFDLSAGSTLSVCAIVYSICANHMGLLFAALIALAVGLAAGAINGVIISRFKVNPFVATLGTGSIYLGIAYIISQSNPITVTKVSFQTLGNNAWLGVPIDVWLLAVAIGAAAFILAKTKFGRSVYAVGGNAEASRLCGIRVDGVRATTYVVIGGAAAVAGMVVASRLSIVTASIGANESLTAIAIVVVGGTSLLGGEGAIWRTVVGFLILESLTNVLEARAVNANWQDIATGAVLIGAVAIDVVARRFVRRNAGRLRSQPGG